jgi:parallel beta-helix repeat protein
MDRKTRRRVALGAVCAAGLALPIAVALPSLAAQTSNATRAPAAPVANRAAQAVSVSSVSALTTAIANAVPGDTISLAAGKYSSGTIKINRSGTADKPITISAASVGATEIGGSTKLDLTGASHVVVQGFVFTSNADLTVPVGATANRVTRNTFSSNKSGAYLTVAADDTEVDHNTFQNKTTAGVFLQVVGPGAHDMAKRVHVHHNYFYNHQFKGSNGGESIRFGLSGRQHGDAQGLIEYNLFEKADGDSEAISIKSSNNVVRYNTLLNTRGTISLRHGWGTTVEGNFVIGGTSGIRFFGNNHTIINNVVQDSSGQPLEVGGGEIRDDTNNTTAHEAADHCLVAFNTLVTTTSNVIRYGSDKKFAPSDVTVADNVIVGKGGTAVRGTGTNLKFQGNILNGAPAGTMPASGFKTVDPKLVRGAGNVFRLSAGSPAIDAATGSFSQVKLDIDQATRTGTFDVGSDEFSAGGPQAKPLTTADVGPKAP